MRVGSIYNSFRLAKSDAIKRKLERLITIRCRPLDYRRASFRYPASKRLSVDNNSSVVVFLSIRSLRLLRRKFFDEGIEENCPIFARFSHTDIISSSILNTTIYIMIIEIFADERREHLTRSRCSPNTLLYHSPLTPIEFWNRNAMSKF